MSDHPICPVIYFLTLEEITIVYEFWFAETEELNAKDFRTEINIYFKGQGKLSDKKSGSAYHVHFTLERSKNHTHLVIFLTIVRWFEIGLKS